MDIEKLIQELLPIPATRWKHLSANTHQNYSQDPYLDSYTLEYQEYLIHLDSHYRGVMSGTVNLSVFGRNNGCGKKIGETETMRKDILSRAGQIPPAIAELYDRIYQHYNSE